MLRHFLKSFAASAGMKGLALLLAFLLQLVLARVMGAQWYGEVTYALAWLGMLAVVAVAGADGAALRFVAELDTPERRHGLLGFFRWAYGRCGHFLKYVFPAGLLLSLFLYFTNPEFALVAFLIVLAGLYFQSRNLLSVSIIQGLRRPALSQFPLGVALPLLLMAILMGFVVTGIEARSEYVAVAYVVALFLVYLWNSWFVGKQMSKHDAGNKEVRVAEWDDVAHQLLLMGVIGLLLSRFDILLLGWFVPADQVGVYNISARLAEMASLALVVSNLIVAPMIARYYKAEDSGSLQHLLTLSGRIVALATLFAVVVLIFAGEYILSWYGASFIAGYEVLIILAVGQLVNALFGPVGNVLIMTGNTAVALRLYGVSAVIMMLMSLVLTPMFGMLGAAVASAFGVIFWNVLMCRYIVSHLGIDPTVMGIFGRFR